MIYGYEMDKYVIEVSNMLFEKLDKVQFINQDIWIKKPRLKTCVALPDLGL